MAVLLHTSHSSQLAAHSAQSLPSVAVRPKNLNVKNWDGILRELTCPTRSIFSISTTHDPGPRPLQARPFLSQHRFNLAPANVRCAIKTAAIPHSSFTGPHKPKDVVASQRTAACTAAAQFCARVAEAMD